MSENIGEPVQIIKYNLSKREFELELPLLENILLHPDVRDASIAVVSIAGAFRKGKSFMLSFFLRYLDAVFEKNQSDWLGDENAPLSGFAWRGGFRRHTTGIWIWSKVFTKVLSNGEKVGIMLMDTQGTFDSSSTMKDNVTIFSLSTMLSSVQIYNLFNNIQEDNLQHLQLFTEYGKLAIEQSLEKPFQMLLFLVRDWSFPYEAPYGFKGGRQVLEKALKITEDQDDELKYVRTHLKSCYDKLDCFLMPYPGRIATVSQDFNGKLEDIDQDFKDMLKEFVPAILSPETILPKKVNGAKVSGLSFISYIESYWNVFKQGGAPTPQTILMATAEANNLSAKDEASEYYHSQMELYTGSLKPFYEFSQMVTQHNCILDNALEIFKKRAIMGDEKMRNLYHAKLSDDLQSQFLLYLGQNEAKQTKNLEGIIGNLSSQVANFQTTTEQQLFQMQSLQTQIEQYRQSSENEKAQLRAEIARLHQIHQERAAAAAAAAAAHHRRRKRICSVM